MKSDSDKDKLYVFIDKMMEVDPTGVRDVDGNPDAARPPSPGDCRELRSLLRQAYPIEQAGASATRGLARFRSSQWLMVASAASLAFLLGVLTPWQPGEQRVHGGPGLASEVQQAQAVLLHVAGRDPVEWRAALDQAEQLSRRNVRVQLLANSDGLDLLRASSSPYAGRVSELARRYPNLAIVACAAGLGKLQEQGLDTRLLDGVNTANSAIEEVAEKVGKGWQYRKI